MAPRPSASASAKAAEVVPTRPVPQAIPPPSNKSEGIDDEAEADDEEPYEPQVVNQPHCGKCGSTSFSMMKQGYGAGKGIAGCCACGIPGALCGTIGANKPIRICNSCGHKVSMQPLGQTRFGRVLPYVWHCHGLPDRCFTWRSRKMPICARCVGLWTGQGLGIVAALTLFVTGSLQILGVLGIAGSLGMLACIADWSLQTWAGLPSTNHRRLVTGFIGGMGIPLVSLAILALGAVYLAGV